MKQNGRNLNPIKDQEKQKVISSMEAEKNEVAKCLKRIRCLLACCYSQIIVENSQLDGKPPKNEQRGATEEAIL